jgi:hypothetical protein
MRLFHLVLFTTLPACDEELADTKPTGDTGAPAEPDDIAIAGTYVDAFGSEQVITNETWTQTYTGYEPLVFAIASYDNTERVVIAQNGDANSFAPGAWSRFDWVDAADGHLYYCQSAFDAATEELAVDTPRPDDSDPAGAGCGGFAWTDLTP